MKIHFLHPDLGIGGAERFIVTLAHALQGRGHKVVVYTSHYDSRRAFPEAAELDIRVHGSGFPRSLFGFCALICVLVRALILCWAVRGESRGVKKESADVYVVDQLSAYALMLPRSAKVLYYCHFPDRLLVRGRRGWARALYRYPLDALEEWGTRRADAVCVNSEFTKAVFEREFGTSQGVQVVHPGIPVRNKDGSTTEEAVDGAGSFSHSLRRDRWIVSVNRFEGKKRIDLAVRAFAALVKTERHQDVRLLVAGGHDSRVPENKDILSSLTSLATSLGLRVQVFQGSKNLLDAETQLLFFPNIPSIERDQAFRHARLLLYTPPHEHFGIVPLEAMSHGTPVVAWNNGGPVETVADGVTGVLCGSEEAWPGTVARALEREWDPVAIRKYVERKFDVRVAVDKIESKLRKLCG